MGRRTAKRALHSDVWMPVWPINRVLLAIMRSENRLFRHVSLPFGTSVYAVARKQPGP